MVVRGNTPGLSRVYVQGGVTAAALNFMRSSGFFSIGLIQGQIVALSMYTRCHLICYSTSFERVKLRVTRQ